MAAFVERNIYYRTSSIVSFFGLNSPSELASGICIPQEDYLDSSLLAALVDQGMWVRI